MIIAYFIFHQNSCIVLLFCRFLQYRAYIEEIFQIENNIAILKFRWNKLMAIIFSIGIQNKGAFLFPLSRMAISTNKMAFIPTPHNKSPENVAWSSFGLQSINQFSTSNKTMPFSILFTSKNENKSCSSK